jgi:Ras-related C3 botulinum toxin substrate 1
MLFSCINYPTLENVESKWCPEVSHHIPNVPVFLVGTKADLRYFFICSHIRIVYLYYLFKNRQDEATLAFLKCIHLRPVTSNEGIIKAKEIKASAYFECSAHTRNGIQAGRLNRYINRFTVILKLIYLQFLKML